MSSLDIDREIAELHSSGWIEWNGRRTIWQSPSGALFLGPHGAYVRMLLYPQLSVKRPKTPVSIKPETAMPLA